MLVFLPTAAPEMVLGINVEYTVTRPCAQKTLTYTITGATLL